MKKPKVMAGIGMDDFRWTPYIEELAYWYQDGDLLPGESWPKGPNVALVFGKVYRYWTLQRTSCRVSAARIAAELSLSRRTVQRSLEVLRQDRMIEDTTPNLRYQPHRYVVNGEHVAMLIRGIRAMGHEAELPYIGASHSATLTPVAA